MSRIRLVQGHELVHADPDGSLDLAGSRALLSTMLRKGHAGDRDLLLDVRDGGMELTYEDVWTLVQHLDAHAPRYAGRLALLDRWDEGFDRMQFLEACAREELTFTARAFIHFEEAVRWLWDTQLIGA